jgi:hypothetical protein
MAVIGISYDGCSHDYDDDGNRIELNPSTLVYHHVYIHTSEKKFEFKSGDFVKDWFQAKMKYAKELQDKEPHLAGSSTCDHFHMDGAEYDSAYLHIENDKGVLKYIDRTDPNYIFTQRDIYEDGWEMFVDPGTKPTWEELKERCK